MTRDLVSFKIERSPWGARGVYILGYLQTLMKFVENVNRLETF